MADSYLVTTPMDVGAKLTEPKGQEAADAKGLPYRELVGSLMYLATATRPDIAHVVSSLSQFSTDYTREHWTAAKRSTTIPEENITHRNTFWTSSGIIKSVH